jgi:hypothetical protein
MSLAIVAILLLLGYLTFIAALEHIPGKKYGREK